MARTIVYIDGFNLYYGALKRTPYKWLDVGRLCALMLPQDDIVAINYYTALVSARPQAIAGGEPEILERARDRSWKPDAHAVAPPHDSRHRRHVSTLNMRSARLA